MKILFPFLLFCLPILNACGQQAGNNSSVFDTTKIIVEYHDWQNPLPLKKSDFDDGEWPGIYAYRFNADTIIQYEIVSYELVFRDKTKEINRFFQNDFHLSVGSKELILKLDNIQRNNLFLENILIKNNENKTMRISGPRKLISH